MSDPTQCPKCKTNLVEEMIEFFKRQRDEGVKMWEGMTNDDIQRYINQFYGKPPHLYNRVIGLEFQGEYDGISAWKCPDCNYEWNRFTGLPITYPFTRAQNNAHVPISN